MALRHILPGMPPEVRNQTALEIASRSPPADITNLAGHKTPEWANCNEYYAIYWNGVEVLFPGEASYDDQSEKMTMKFLDHFYRPRHSPGCDFDSRMLELKKVITCEVLIKWAIRPEQRPSVAPRIEQDNIRGLVNVYRLLRGNRDFLRIKIMFKDDRYPDSRHPSHKRQVWQNLDIHKQVLRIVGAGLDLYHRYLDGNVTRSRFIGPAVANDPHMSDVEKEHLVIDWFAQETCRLSADLFNRDNNRSGHVKFWMMEHFDIPEAERLRDRHVWFFVHPLMLHPPSLFRFQ